VSVVAVIVRRRFAHLSGVLRPCYLLKVVHQCVLRETLRDISQASRWIKRTLKLEESDCARSEEGCREKGVLEVYADQLNEYVGRSPEWVNSYIPVIRLLGLPHRPRPRMRQGEEHEYRTWRPAHSRERKKLVSGSAVTEVERIQKKNGKLGSSGSVRAN
jgi:hypothetical protein